MLFSGVTHPKSAAIMAALLPTVSLFWSVAMPKYFLPLALNLTSMLVLVPDPGLAVVVVVEPPPPPPAVVVVGFDVVTAVPGIH
jgi:hypothetical protein